MGKVLAVLVSGLVVAGVVAWLWNGFGAPEDDGVAEPSVPTENPESPEPAAPDPGDEAGPEEEPDVVDETADKPHGESGDEDHDDAKDGDEDWPPANTGDRKFEFSRVPDVPDEE